MTSSFPIRADVYLANLLDTSRSSVAELFKKDLVYINNKLAKPSSKLYEGDELIYKKPEIKELKPSEYEIDFKVDILYEDEFILIVNKPTNVATHGCTSLKEASLVEWLYQNNYKLSNIAGEQRAGIIHRLDKPTSGALIVAKSNAAHSAFSELIAQKQAERIYLALINLSTEGICERYIKRAPNNRLKMLSLSKEAALAKYGNLEKAGRYSKSEFISLDDLANPKMGHLIAAKLSTGRTHQIRSHLASLNRFIYGDNQYAPKELSNVERLMLHSFNLAFIHPFTKEHINIIAPLDEVFLNLINLKKDINEQDLSNQLKQRFSI